MTGRSAAETAARDQTLALARDLARNGASTVFADYPDGQPCCWCDCPIDAPDTFVCSGCGSPADAVLRLFPSFEPGDCWPVCTAHRADAVRVLAACLVSADTG